MKKYSVRAAQKTVLEAYGTGDNRNYDPDDIVKVLLGTQKKGEVYTFMFSRGFELASEMYDKERKSPSLAAVYARSDFDIVIDDSEIKKK